MNVRVTKNANVLIPNGNHKNFTTTDQIIPEGTILTGNYKEIVGLRRGKPFAYRVFISNSGIVLYKNQVENMATTEVKLGADGSTSKKINLMVKQGTILAALGALGGYAYAYAHKKNKSGKTTYVVAGAVLGWLAGAALTQISSKKQ